MLPSLKSTVGALSWASDKNDALPVITDTVARCQQLAPTFQTQHTAVAWDVIMDMSPHRQLKQVQMEVSAREDNVQLLTFKKRKLERELESDNLDDIERDEAQYKITKLERDISSNMLDIYNLGLKLNELDVQYLSLDDFAKSELEGNLYHFARQAIRELRTGQVMLGNGLQEYAENLKLHIPTIMEQLVGYVNVEMTTKVNPHDFCLEFAKKHAPAQSH